VEDRIEDAVKLANTTMWKTFGSMLGFRSNLALAPRSSSSAAVTPALLAEVARVYRENLDGNPTEAVAKYTGREHRTAALYVQRARKAGLLGPTSPGRKGEQS
jgi:hypothetical protein